MKKLLGTLVFAAALMHGAVAQAAEINIIATEQADGTTWILSLETTLPVAAIAITAPDSAGFSINAANTAIAPLGSGSSFGPGATPGLFSLNLNPSTCAGINCTPFGTSTVLGTFIAAPGILSLIGPDDESVGGTAFDGVLSPYDLALIEVRNVPVPEPGVAVMLGLGLAALGLVRRKAA